MITSLRPILLAATVATLLAACGQNKPDAEASRSVRAAGAEAEHQRLNALRLDCSVSTSDDEHAQSGLRLPRRLPRPQRTRLAAHVDSNASNTHLLRDSIQLDKALAGGWQVFEPNQESSS